MVRHEVLIVGAGLAGLRAAIEAADAGLDVAVLSKVHPVRSHSGEAQGGINAALGNHPEGRDDSPERHAYDTAKGSDFLADQDAVQILTAEAPARIYELEHWGCPFSRTAEGRIAQRPFGGAGFPRTCFGADKTGHYILHTLYEQCIKRGVRWYEEFLVLRLAVAGGACPGLVALDLRRGALVPMGAKAVLFATGGVGRIYGKTSNALISTGLAVAIPYWTGIPVKDMEFVQFHPTTIYGKNILMTEGCRGEGGTLVNGQGERFMARYAPKAMELAPRDIVSRSIQTEIIEGRGIDGGPYVHLDIRHLGAAKIHERLPGIREICLDFLGIDPVEAPIPIQPGTHYAMGGIDTDKDGATAVEGFFAAGECACVSVHGANRLGGNSLLETVVFGRRAGASAAAFARGAPHRDGDRLLEEARRAEEARIARLFGGAGREDPSEVKRELNRTMDEAFGIFRNGADMAKGVEAIRSLRERLERARPIHSGKGFNFDLLWTLELLGSAAMAEVIGMGALARTESRGSHFRTDYPKRDDGNWLWHTLAHWTPKGPEFARKPVTITRWQPEERKY